MFPQVNIPFADIFNYYLMVEEGIKEIYSYDEDLDKFEGIKRLEPD